MSEYIMGKPDKSLVALSLYLANQINFELVGKICRSFGSLNYFLKLSDTFSAFG